MEEIKRKDPGKQRDDAEQSTPKSEKATAKPQDEEKGTQNKTDEDAAPSADIVTNTGDDIPPGQADADAASG
jgi:hypothetical protein